MPFTFLRNWFQDRAQVFQGQKRVPILHLREGASASEVRELLHHIVLPCPHAGVWPLMSQAGCLLLGVGVGVEGGPLFQEES